MEIINGFFSTLFGVGDFEPHYVHFTEEPFLMWALVVGNATIAVAYFIIPFVLAYYARRRKDVVDEFHWVFWLFGIFIFLCGSTHALHVLTFWYPAYWLQAMVDFLTGLVSFGTAIALFWALPRLLSMPSPQEIREKNTRLEQEIIQRQRAEEEVKVLNAELERRVEERTRELETSRQRFARILASNVVGIRVLDETGRIIDANDIFLDLIGYSREDLKRGIMREDITPEEHRAAEETALEGLKEAGTTKIWEKEYVRKDGSRVPVLIGAVLAEGERENVAFVLDMTERKKLEERKDDFVGVASHELKTPVTSLKMFAQTLRSKLEDAGRADLAKHMDAMDRQLGRLSTLITGLLDVSRARLDRLDYEFAEFDLNAMVKETCDLAAKAAKTHRVDIAEKDRVSMVGDRARIEQVILNLLDNAIKYSPKSDKVDVKISKGGDAALIEVRDYGFGIPHEDKERIFERFYQSHQAATKTFPGLGLGLYISREIAARHGGTIAVESDPGRGSTFTLSLPLRGPEGAA